MKIERFRIAVDESDIIDLKNRIRAPRWPAPARDAKWSLGMDIEYLRSLVEYWRDQFDWRAIEAALNLVPQFQAATASGSIHFVHLRSNEAKALPIILTHGWPSTYAELLTLGKMLANPAAHGLGSEDAFDVVIPSLPGYIFSSAPALLGTDLYTIADQWSELMAALGYARFIAHGGDIGAGVSTALGLKHAERLLGVHLNFIPGSYEPDMDHGPELSIEEQRSLAQRADWFDREGGYSHVQRTKPDTLGPALNDSAVGLAAWIVDKFRSWSDCDGDIERRFSRDEILTTVSLYWFTRSMPSAIRLYWESRRRPLRFAAGEKISVPVGIAHFPRELPIPAKPYVERGYNITHWSEMPKGGHFAALEEPEMLARDIRAFANGLR